tara:strand:+ start:213 stop:1838 length:1626 start_codon:yes stop_codon:yes gene_type:complete
MPKISEKAEVLGGRGTVVKYSSGTSQGFYFYREWVKQDRRYLTKRIDNASTLDEAIDLAPDAAFALREQALPVANQSNYPPQLANYSAQPKRRKPRSITIESAVNAWVYQETQRYNAGMIRKNTILSKEMCMRTKVLGYLQEHNITHTHQINENTFDEYLLWRYRKTDRKLVITKEIGIINEWAYKYLLKNKYISLDILFKGKGLIPQITVKQEDRMANPAINADDWRVILNYVRNEWRFKPVPPPEYFDIPDKRTYFDTSLDRRDYNNWEKHWFYQNLFWHFILLSKLTGMSPEETLKLKWKNVDIKDVGRISNTKRKEAIKDLLEDYKEHFGDDMDDQVGGVNTIASSKFKNQVIDPAAWAPEKDKLGREERLIAYIYTTRAKTGASREIPCNAGSMLKRWMKFVKEHIKSQGIDMPINGETHVFASPYNEDFKPCHYIWCSRNWREVRRAVKDKLRGHRFSNHPYTLYSLRSTFIEDHLIKGTDIFLLARIAGHDVKELQRSYERMDIRFRAKEITDIEYGKRKEVPEDVNLLEMDFD